MSIDATPTTSYVVRALPDQILADARSELLDGPGVAGATQQLAAAGGEPLRCCLRDAVPGERLILFNYHPPLPASSPYQERGAVYAHADAEECAAHEPSSGYPEAWRGRPQVLRAYDARGFIHPATHVHDGSRPERAIAEVFADPEVVLVHSRNVAYGCYMFAIERRS